MHFPFTSHKLGSVQILSNPCFVISKTIKRCFIDCSEEESNQPTIDVPMTTTYESIDPSSTADDTTYTPIHQKPQHDYENVENTR